MKFTLLALSALMAAAMAQDTFHCPDGWELHEHHGDCSCFLFSGSERVTREDADILCTFHDGAWVAEPSHPGLSYWMKSKLLETTEIGEYALFWLGAHATGRHSENSPGEWVWDSSNSTVEWFDWADGEPNNYGNSGEMCLSMMEIHDPFFPIFRDYFWNDLGCDEAAHYICQNTCFQ